MVTRRIRLIALIAVVWVSLCTVAQPYEPADVQLQSSLSSPKPYVLEQVVYRLRISSRHPIVNANLQPPTIDGQPLPQLGSKRLEQKDGRHIIELLFSIVSKKSGVRTIEAPALQALVKMDDDLFSPYGMKEVTARGHDVTLTIRSIPAAFSGSDWLPAERLVVTDDWSPSLEALRVGQSVTRTVILHAEGVSATQLPEIQFPSIPGVNIYPDKPEMSTELRDSKLVATKVFKFAFVPTQSGDLSIPALNVPWWNVKQDQQNVATIPSARMHIKGVVPANATSTSANSLPPAEPTTASMPPHPVLASSHAPWWLWGVALSGWLAFFWLGWIHRRVSKKEVGASPSGSETRKSLARQLKKACFANRTSEAYALALRTVQVTFPEHTLLNLQDVLKLVPDEGLAEQIRRLNEVRFTDRSPSDWTGSVFWAAFQSVINHRPESAGKRADSALPPLFIVD